MRHRKKTIKLGRTSAHRDALLASLVCALIHDRRIKTTLAKAKAARSLAEKMVTLAKQGTLAARRRAISRLRREDRVRILFSAIAPAMADRAGGYTRIMRLGRRPGDNAEVVLLEWVNYTPQPPRKKKPAKEKEKDKAPAKPGDKGKKAAGEPEKEKQEKPAGRKHKKAAEAPAG